MRAGVVVAALAVALSGCGEDGSSIGEQARQGEQKGYISGTGLVEQLAPAERTVDIELSGTTLEGEPWTSRDALGTVVVINVWGSWCGPCKAEAPDLEAAYQHFRTTGDPVTFIGVNDKESVATALAFQEAKGIGYPSLADDGGATLVALEGMANTRPATLVLDPQGRLAARVSGQVDESTLRGVVEDVLAE